MGRTLISERRIRRRVRELGAQITTDYRNRETTLLGVLNGSVCFLADLVRQVPLPVSVDFVRLASYRGVESGEIRTSGSLDPDVSGRHVLIVEDIVDTGATMGFLVDRLTGLGAQSVEICTLLDKPGRRERQVEIGYWGFRVPDEYVVGYGLDYEGLYRNLPHIAVLEGCSRKKKSPK